MLHTKVSIVVKAVRLRHAVPVVVLLTAAYLLVIHPWITNWGSTAAERQMTLPGDGLNPGPTRPATMAITINAPAEVVWQWLVQIGQNRAGFYTYTWLENLIGADFHNANEIHPEWQHLTVGDGWRTAQPDYLMGLGRQAVSPVLFIEPGRALVLEMFGAYVIEPIDGQTSRLIQRGPSGDANLVTKMLLDPLVLTMGRRMLLGLKARAEGVSDSPAAFLVIAHIGWAAAGVFIAGLFMTHRRHRYWLVLPVAAALPGLLASRDVQAGLAAFLAVGITLLGFMYFGRAWWSSFLIIASVVLLTLLLAPEAYIAIGLAFLVLVLAAFGAMIAERLSFLRVTPRTEDQASRAGLDA